MTQKSNNFVLENILERGEFSLLCRNLKNTHSNCLLQMLKSFSAGAPYMSIKPTTALKILYIHPFRTEYIEKHVFQSPNFVSFKFDVWDDIIESQEKFFVQLQEGVRSKLGAGSPNLVVFESIKHLAIFEDKLPVMKVFHFLKRLHEQIAPKSGLILTVNSTARILKTHLSYPKYAIDCSIRASLFCQSYIGIFDCNYSADVQIFVEDLYGEERWVTQDAQVVEGGKCRGRLKDKYEKDKAYECILKLIREGAKVGKLFTMSKFAQIYCNTNNLPSKTGLCCLLQGLVALNKITFLTRVPKLGLRRVRGSFGYMSVEGMEITSNKKI